MEFVGNGSCDGGLLVSVIIPCYNQAHFLAEAIESVLAQTYSHFEIVIVDDGSTDNIAEVADHYPAIHWIRQENRGPSAARNTGVENSRGEYMLFLDADDRLLPGAIDAGLAAFEAHPDCAFVAGHYRVIGIDGTLREQLPPHRVGREHYAELLRRNFIGMHATVMYRRAAFDSVGRFNPSLRACEDYDLYLRIAGQFPIYCYPQVIAEYRQHGANTTQNPKLILESALRVLGFQWPAVQGNIRYEEACRAGMRYWQGYYGAQSAGQKDKLATVEILRVSLCEMPNGQLWGRSLEAPKRGGQDYGDTIELTGWVVGRQSPVVGVEVVEKGQARQRLGLNIERQDVAAHFPMVASSAESGFQAWVQVLGVWDSNLLVQAVLQDDSHVPLAWIQARRRLPRPTGGTTAPLVSVIIPCYNQAHFLGEAIESVLGQSYENFEVVVVDDGSTDNTEEVANQYPVARCIRQKNCGLAAARNVGLEHSRGEYVLFLDADDRLLPNALEVGLAAFESHPNCVLVTGQYRLIGGQGDLLEEPPVYPMTCDHYAELLRRNFIRVPATVMYRRAVFTSVGDFDSVVSACADYDLYLRIARRFPIYCHEHVVAEYRQHSANMTRNPALMLKSALRVLQSQWREVKRNSEYKKSYKVGWRAWQDYYGEQLVKEIRNRMRQHKLKEGMKGLPMLLVYHPLGLFSLLFAYSLRRRIREIVCTTLPPNPLLIVTRSRGDVPWKLDRCLIWDFPCFRSGQLVDFSDSISSTEAIQQLEELRRKGSQFFLVPNTSFWWLQHEREFHTHLEAQYPRIWCDERCIIYELSKPVAVHDGVSSRDICAAPCMSDSQMARIANRE